MSNDLRLDGCARCVELEEENDKLKGHLIDAETANAELGRQIAGLQRLLTRSGKAEIALKNELARQREEEPEAADIKAVLVHWKKALGHERAKTPLSGTRAQRVRSRLRERFTVDDLKKAIDGCAKMPYVGPHGRKATGQPGERHDDLTLICRDEETVERFIRYATDTPKQRVADGPRGVTALIERLESVTQARPGQWNARCPVHDDRHASLSVGQGEKGAVVHCHAGCTAEDIARAAGLEIGALFDPEDAPPIRIKAVAEALPSAAQIARWQNNLADHPRLLARLYELRRWSAETLIAMGVGFDGGRLILPVYDERSLLVNVLRYLPKRDSDQPKLLALRGCPRDLFGRIETEEVWLVEGEPDAISGRELGLPAVAVPGSNGWRQAWTQRLTGRRVVVCFDCDEPGRKAAQRIVADLSPVANVVMLDLEPERTDGYDLSDALLDGIDRDLLRAMAESIVEMAA